MPRIDGIDISHWNRITDWGAIPAFRLVSLKATEGTGFVSPVWRERRARFLELGTELLGHYHWLRSNVPVAAQAAHFVRTVGALEVGEFMQNDWEVTKGEPVPTSLMAEEWNDRVRQHYGFDPLITYSSDWLPDSTLDADSRREFDEWRDENPADPLWFANYSLSTGPTGGPAEVARYRADVWQWSSTTKVPGFDPSQGGIDVNEVRDWAVLRRLARYVDVPFPPPDPITPAPLEVPDMILVRNAETHTFTDGKAYAPNSVVWELVNGQLRHVSAAEFGALLTTGVDTATGMPSRTLNGTVTNAQIAALPRYSRSLSGTISGSVSGGVTGTVQVVG